MNDEFPSFTGKHLLFAAVAVISGWALLFTGVIGARVAIQNLDSSRVFVASLLGPSSTRYQSASAIDIEGQAAKSFAPEDSQAAGDGHEATTDLPDENTLTLVFGGDVMFDRQIRKMGEANGYESLLSGMSSLFKKADMVVVNLEGPITSNPSKTLTSDGGTTKLLTFTFDPAAAQALHAAGVTHVSLANNHSDNFGMAGIIETKKWLSQSDIRWFGNPWNGREDDAVSIVEKNGIRVALVGYHAFQKGFDNVVAKVRELASDGETFVVVMPHWGEEYVASASARETNEARRLVQAGAGAIIGAHPHVVGENSWIDSTPVFYSLGNLLFDQYFSPDVKKGILVELRLKDSSRGRAFIDELKVHEVSLSSTNGPELVAD